MFFDKLKADGYEDIVFLYLQNDPNKPIREFLFKLRLLYIILKIILRAKKHDIIFVWDYQYLATRIGFAFFILRRDLKVINYNSMDDIRYLKKKPLKKKIYHFAYGQIITTMSSIEQANIYEQILDIPKWHFQVLQDSLKFHPCILDTIIDRSDNNYIFVGGGTGRAWNDVIQTAKLLPQYKFKVATNLKNLNMIKELSNHLPSNIEFLRLDFLEFSKCEANSSLCYTPLNTDWQGGVTTINDASYLGKMTVTTDTYGIRGYYEKDEIILVQEGYYKKAALLINELMQKPDVRESIGVKAQKRVKEFTFDRFYNRLSKSIFPLIQDKD